MLCQSCFCGQNCDQNRSQRSWRPHSVNSGMSSPSCQTPISNDCLLDHSYSARLPAADKLKLAEKYIEELEEQNKLLSMGKFSARRFAYSDEIIQFYTGFPSYTHLETTYRNLRPTALIINRWVEADQGLASAAGNSQLFQCNQLSIFDQFFMFLCYVRQGLPEIDLSIKFATTESVVYQSVATWANYLYFVLNSISIWMEKTQVAEMMPRCFTETFPGTRIVLHYTEVRGQTDSTSVVNSWMYADSASSKTFKGLIGFAPHGTITFVSELFAGSVLEPDIVAHSGLLTLLEPMDSVMVDQELKMGRKLASMGCHLIMPPFLTNSGREYSEENRQLTQRITRMCIHVERVIHRVKMYLLFEKPLPRHVLSYVNQLWTVCVLLTNFHGPLIEDL